MAWALVTFLAVPVMAIEGTGPFGTLKRSATIFKDKWGQQITGNIAIGGAVFLLRRAARGAADRRRRPALVLGSGFAALAADRDRRRDRAASRC